MQRLLQVKEETVVVAQDTERTRPLKDDMRQGKFSLRFTETMNFIKTLQHVIEVEKYNHASSD